MEFILKMPPKYGKMNIYTDDEVLMSEKIKVNVSKSTAQILMKDAEAFEFYKKDGSSLNRNALYTRIIINYYDTFRSKQTELFTYLKKSLAVTKERADVLDELCYKVLEHINRREASDEGGRFNVTLSVKPTKESEGIISYIEEYLINQSTLSEYFRNMFASYAALPQDEREQIVFRTQYETLQSAIQEGRKVFITTGHGREKKIEVAPYALTESKEELHTYLLSSRDGDCMPLRLSRIATVRLLANYVDFSEEEKDTFERMLKYGPQFKYGKNEGEVHIKLTARGIEMFRKMYVHRPVPVRIVDNSYYFECSHTQIIQYFVRFGKEAYVVYPDRVRDMIVRFHKEACDMYANAGK